MQPDRNWYQKKRFIIPAIVTTPFIVSMLTPDYSDNKAKTEERYIPQDTKEIKIQKPSKNSDLSSQKVEGETNIPTPKRGEMDVVKQKAEVEVTETKQCHPSYSGCLNPNASDYDCAGGSGNGPYYTGLVQVIGPDVYDLDRDNDGVGCE